MSDIPCETSERIQPTPRSFIVFTSACVTQPYGHPVATPILNPPEGGGGGVVVGGGGAAGDTVNGQM